MEKLQQSPKRVFINNIDSYASKYIAKVSMWDGRIEPVKPVANISVNYQAAVERLVAIS